MAADERQKTPIKTDVLSAFIGVHRRPISFSGIFEHPLPLGEYYFYSFSASGFAGAPNLTVGALAGDRSGRHSIRVNDQWRICFRWVAADALEVEIVDYH